MTSKLWLFLALAALSLVRLFMAGWIELSPDEAYYLLWSEHPDVSYYHNGPGVAAAIWLSTHLFGASEFATRFFSPLLALGTSLLLFSFAKRLYSESIAIWTVVLVNLLPLYHVKSVLIGPDALSLFFWAAAMQSFWLALEHTTNREDPLELGSGWSPWWPVTGALIGIGFLCQWTNAMQLVSIFIVMLSSSRFRSHFHKPGFWSLLLVFALFTIPPLLWNAGHQWVHFSPLSEQTESGTPWNLSARAPIAFIGVHLALYSPGIFAALLVSLQASFHRVRDHFKPRFLVAFTAPLLLAQLVMLIQKAGQTNWTAPAMLSLSVLAVAHWHERALNSFLLRRVLGASLALGLLLSTLGLNMDLIRNLGIPWPYESDPSQMLHGWQSTALKIHELRKRVEEEIQNPVFLIGDGFATSSITGFYLPEKQPEGQGHPAVYIAESQAIESQFSFWPRYDEFLPLKPGQKPRDPQFSEESAYNPFHGRTALYITTSTSEEAPSSLTQGFERVELEALYELKRRGQKLREIRVFRCSNYRSLSL